MTDQELQHYKKKLLEKLVGLKQSIQDMGESVLERSRMDATGDITNIPTHIADISADSFWQDLTLGLIENKERVIKNIESALERIENGSYGICENCNEEISKKRLDHVPYTKLCINCKMEDERKQHGYGGSGWDVMYF
jgi:RNA polymerase-binding protein DksA